MRRREPASNLTWSFVYLEILLSEFQILCAIFHTRSLYSTYFLAVFPPLDSQYLRDRSDVRIWFHTNDVMTINMYTTLEWSHDRNIFHFIMILQEWIGIRNFVMYSNCHHESTTLDRYRGTTRLQNTKEK